MQIGWNLQLAKLKLSEDGLSTIARNVALSPTKRKPAAWPLIMVSLATLLTFLLVWSRHVEQSHLARLQETTAKEPRRLSSFSLARLRPYSESG